MNLIDTCLSLKLYYELLQTKVNQYLVNLYYKLFWLVLLYSLYLKQKIDCKETKGITLYGQSLKKDSGKISFINITQLIY